MSNDLPMWAHILMHGIEVERHNHRLYKRNRCGEQSK